MSKKVKYPRCFDAAMWLEDHEMCTRCACAAECKQRTVMEEGVPGVVGSAGITIHIHTSTVYIVSELKEE